MTRPPADLDGIKQRHHRDPGDPIFCDECSEKWPCDAIQLADLVSSLLAQLTEAQQEKELKRPTGGASKDVIAKSDQSTGVPSTDGIWKLLNEADDHKSTWHAQGGWGAWFVQLVDAVSAFDRALVRYDEETAAYHGHRDCHSVVCNGDWTYPRGSVGHGCSCFTWDVRLHEENAQLRFQVKDQAETLERNTEILNNHIDDLSAQLAQAKDERDAAFEAAAKWRDRLAENLAAAALSSPSSGPPKE